MAARLIVSIDCEGRWGIADRGERRLGVINNDRLRDAYQKILSILERHKSSATFGFVAALCLEEEELLHAIRRCGEKLRFGEVDWLAEARKSLEMSQSSGWVAPELIDLVVQAGRHHLCSHGGYHIPYDQERVSVDAIDEDVGLIKYLEIQKGMNFETIIFPRNVVGFKSRLVGAGFCAYRDIDRREVIPGLRGKFDRLVSEFISNDRCDTLGFSYRRDEGMVALSPGKFLNSKNGIRKIVRSDVTCRRIDCMLGAAVKNNSIVHFYTHPHNFITDETMVEKFDYLFARAREYENRGVLKIITMKEELHEAITI